jgi:hypothetical protein
MVMELGAYGSSYGTSIWLASAEGEDFWAYDCVHELEGKTVQAALEESPFSMAARDD